MRRSAALFLLPPPRRCTASRLSSFRPPTSRSRCFAALRWRARRAFLFCLLVLPHGALASSPLLSACSSSTFVGDPDSSPLASATSSFALIRQGSSSSAQAGLPLRTVRPEPTGASKAMAAETKGRKLSQGESC